MVGRGVSPAAAAGAVFVRPSIATSSGHTVVVKSDGSVWTFGYNSYGQLGRNASNTQDLTPLAVGSLPTAVSAGAGDFHSAVVMADGTVRTFGGNINGQLGASAISSNPQPVPVEVPGLSGVRSVAGSWSHTVALKHDGTVWTFGRNVGGELGRSTLYGTDDPVPGRAALDGVIAVAASFSNTLALRADGTVWAFGKNSSGQLGLPKDLFPHDVPEMVPGLDGVVAIASGLNHSVALRFDGTVWTFGANSSGQLGRTTPNGLGDPTPTQVPGLNSVSAIAAGTGVTVALRSDGTVWSFGSNGDGALGRSTVGGFDPAPGMMNGLTGVTAIATGGTQTSALTVDGSVWMVGGLLPTRVVPGLQVLDVPPLSPGRLLDTRVGAGTLDGSYAGVGLRAGGSVTPVAVVGRGGASVLAQAAALNVTVTEAVVAGFVTVFPCGSPLPNASQVNFVSGQTIANLVLAKLGVGQQACVYTSAPTHLIVDFVDSYSGTGSFNSVVPARLVDSRSNAGTVDGVGASLGRRAAGSVTEVVVAGRAGISSAATSVALNVTAVAPSSSGYFTVFPCGSALPFTSSVNFRSGQVIANAVLARIGSGGKVCIQTSAEADLIVDVSGEFSSTYFTPGSLVRLADTRSANSTVDGLFAGGGVRAAGSEFEVQVSGRGGLASGVLRVSMNVTVTGTQGEGYVTVYPCGTRPGSSNINFAAGQTIANAVMTPVSKGKVCIFTSAATHLIVDVNGTLPGQLP